MAVKAWTAVVAALALCACGGRTEDPVSVGMGPEPRLPEPTRSLLPAVNVAEAKGWGEGEAPVPAAGLRVSRFAEGLDHPRWLLVLPNGDVLVAESNAPARSGRDKTLKDIAQDLVMKRAGAGVPSADRITLLRDADKDGVAETQTPFATGLTSPFGMALVGDSLYVANTDAVVRFPYTLGQTAVQGPPQKVADLPAGVLNYHWTKSLVASPDGAKLYVGVGSNSNVGENGLEEEEGRAAVWEIDVATGTARVFAGGLRNPVGIDFEPSSNTLWVAVNERDELGHNLVPDYMTSVKDGAFYGWPWSYWGSIVDTRVKPARPDMVEKAIAPDYALGAHTASLGLTFADGAALGPAFAQGAFIGQHGSWNRNPPSGYKVVFVPFANGRPEGMPVDVLTGFREGDIAMGRPVGVEIAKDGALLVADDVGNVIWRVSAAR